VIESRSNIQYCHVAVPAPVDSPFLYVIPERMKEHVTVGVRAVVPFGGRLVTGVVTALLDEPDTAAELKELERVVDPEPVLDESLMRLGRWISDYYHAPDGEVYRAMLPLGVEVETRRMVRLTLAGENFLSPITDALKKRPLPEKTLRKRFALSVAELRRLERDGIVERVSEARATAERREYLVELAAGIEDIPRKREQRVVQLLISDPQPWPASELAAKAKVPAALLRDMTARGMLRMAVVTPRAAQPNPGPRHKLNAGQETALGEIRAALTARKFAAFLLQGVTGSGKTEVYMRAMEEVLAAGGTALMLVPEIALTPAVAEQFQNRFGDAVAILHSGFAERERSRQWRRIKSGEARIVVGTRSGVFAPLQRLDLVIVDEEQDGSYKQEDTPRYNGRDVAVVRARDAGAVVVLGSATPSLESRYNTERGKYRRLLLADRVENRPMAEVTVVDMRQEFQERKKQSTFSRLLIKQLGETLEAGEQAMILLNRRGFSSFVLCRSCGESVQCENCSIALTHHRGQNRLLCHYCEYWRSVPKVCPKCESEHIYFMGEGTERIEDLLTQQFPKSRIGRLDRDTVRGRDQFEGILQQFRDGRYDVLVGTQMIAKGHDIHNVTLVGVISADTALGLPDFRAAERTFQLLTQVAGRAGRGTRPGRVILQTYCPEHYAIQKAAAQDYESFYEKELRFRRVMHYPPFTALAAILIRHERLEEALKISAVLNQRIAAGKWDGVRVLGPAAAPLLRLKKEFRYQFLIKSQRRDVLNTLLRDLRACAVAEKFPPAAMVFDADPLSLL
jgi:primosomal protein N' (replication factor Y)